MSEKHKDAVSRDEVRALIKRTDLENPHPDDVAELKRVFQNDPDLWKKMGSLTWQAGMRLIQEVKATLSVKEATAQEYRGIERDLGRNEAHGLERLLIENVALCHLRLTMEEHSYTGRYTGSMTISEANFHEKRLDAAQRRFLRASETLARVRKITRQTVALQVNIAADGGKQVNVLGDVA